LATGTERPSIESLPAGAFHRTLGSIRGVVGLPAGPTQRWWLPLALLLLQGMPISKINWPLVMLFHSASGECSHGGLIFHCVIATRSLVLFGEGKTVISLLNKGFIYIL